MTITITLSESIKFRKATAPIVDIPLVETVSLDPRFFRVTILHVGKQLDHAHYAICAVLIAPVIFHPHLSTFTFFLLATLLSVSLIHFYYLLPSFRFAHTLTHTHVVSVNCWLCNTFNFQPPNLRERSWHLCKSIFRKTIEIKRTLITFPSCFSLASLLSLSLPHFIQFILFLRISSDDWLHCWLIILSHCWSIIKSVEIHFQSLFHSAVSWLTSSCSPICFFPCKLTF